MGKSIEAIYENGVFRPLGDISLPEGARVVLWIEILDRSEDDADAIAQQKLALEQLNAELAGLPDNSHDDGLSSEDHDQILYGGPREKRP
jgi:predicted DNA-binding antitoxin AbrB/MazE fold protein